MKLFLCILAITLLISCGNKAKSKDSTTPTDTTITTQVETNYPTDSLKGEYIGIFGNSTIILVINLADGKKASGYDIVKGNRRNIHGDMMNKGACFQFNLFEPGGYPFDGSFNFTIDTTAMSLEGTWTAFDSTNIKSKKYKLIKRHPKHSEREGCVGTWHFNGLSVDFNVDQTGMAKGDWYDEKNQTDTQVEIPFSWFQAKTTVSIEWGKNNIFKSSKMKFKFETDEYEEMLQCDEFIMYRY